MSLETYKLLDFDLLIALYIDGVHIKSCHVRAGKQHEIQGIRNSATTRLPFKFQELELVGAFQHSLDIRFVPHLLLKLASPLPLRACTGFVVCTAKTG